MSSRKQPYSPARTRLSALCLCALIVCACGDDPTAPEFETITRFDKDLASAFIGGAVGEAAGLAVGMWSLTYDVNSLDYDWDPDEVAWIRTYDHWAGYTDVSLRQSVQYLDDTDTPVRYIPTAEAVRYRLTGSAHAEISEGAYELSVDFEYDHDFRFQGVHTDELTLTGFGIMEIEADFSGPERRGRLTVPVTWDALGDGVDCAQGGCPDGYARYALTPYQLMIEMTGQEECTATLYDDIFQVVPGEIHHGTLNCGDN